MECRVERQPVVDGIIIGRWFNGDVSVCDTLERADVAIPLGRYLLVIRTSYRFQRLLPHVENVPHRTGILVHPGNYGEDTEGCILVGESHTPSAVFESKLAMSHVQQAIAITQAQGEQNWLTVANAPITHTEVA